MRRFLRSIVPVPALGVLLQACTAGGTPRVAPTPDRQMIEFSELTSATVPPADLRDAYGPAPQQFGELRLPSDSSGKRPVVVLIHGGCWRSAFDLTHAAPAAEALAQAGYVVWVPEYRRLGDAGGGWPGTFEDVARAIDHVRVLAARVPAIDTTRVVLAGHSAGGQLALWGAARRLERAGAPSAAYDTAPLRVAGVVSLAGITDLASYGAGTGSCNSAVPVLMGGAPAERPERYGAVSPVERLPLGVPVRLVHGDRDPIVPLSLSERYVERARASGDEAVLTTVAGAGHFDVMAPHARAWHSVIDAVRALATPAARP